MTPPTKYKLYPPVGRKLVKRVWKKIGFIDPGVEGTGLAHWESLPRGKRSKPDSHRSWFFQAKSAHQRRWSYGMALREFLRSHRLKTLVIEYPEMWAGSAKSWTATVRGNLFSLATLCGVLEHVAMEYQLNLIYVYPREWKGQLNKTAIATRVARCIGTSYSTSHELEAVAMGLSAARVL